jgi:hypothetical protein
VNTGDTAPWWRDGDRRTGNGLAVVLLVATTLVLLVLLGVLVGWGLDGGGAQAAPRPSITAGPLRPPSPSPSPTGSPPPGAAGAAAGDCLTNENTGGDPDLVVTACRSGTYRVLKRFAGTADAHRCDTVAGTTDDYAQRDLAAPSRSFVLCLQKQ